MTSVLSGCGLLVRRCVRVVVPTPLLMLAKPWIQAMRFLLQIRCSSWHSMLNIMIGWVPFRRVWLQIAGLYRHTCMPVGLSGLKCLPSWAWAPASPTLITSLFPVGPTLCANGLFAVR